jgi:hypothetical protein
VELVVHDLVVAVEERPPALVAQFRGPAGRADEVGEQHCLEHPV